MALSLAGVNFFGTIGHIRLGDWQFDVKRTKFFGVIGTSEILGGVGSRSIEAPYWLYNSFETGAAIADAMHELDSYIGTHGTLTETGTISRTFEHTTFDGCSWEKGPFYSPNGGWLAIGTLRFTQLAPNGT